MNRPHIRTFIRTNPFSPCFPEKKKSCDPKDHRTFGGEGEIRTLEPFMAVTRFPVVRPRPTRRLLHDKYEVRFSPRFDSLPQKLPQVNSFMQFSEFIFIFLRGRGFFIRKDTRFLCVCCHFAQKQNCIFSMRNRWFRLWHIKVG